MEENFEKKSCKKIWKIIPIVILLVVIATIIGILYLNKTKNPENIFEKAIEEAFEMLEIKEVNSQKVELDMALSIESNDHEIKAVNEILKAVELKSTIEVDLEKEIYNGNILATYDGEQVISIDGLIQNERLYFYLKDIYSKYIEVDKQYLEGVNLSELFNTETQFINEDVLEDIEQILLDEVKSKEYTQEEIKIDGKKVQKSTLRLTVKEVLEITLEVMEKINEYQATTEIGDLIAELEYEIEYSEDNENYVDISIYTKGLKNEIVKADAVFVNVEDDEVIIFESNIVSEDEKEINFLLNEDSTEVSEAEEIIEITVNTENENNGTAKIKLNIEEGNSITLKIKYSVYNNPKIKERNTSNSITVDSFAEEDAIEIIENVQDNEILYGIIQMFMTNMEEETVYDSEYNYDTDYDYEYNYEYVY